MVKKAGCGGGFDGLCCRMVIETKRVFDGCAFTDRNITFTLTTSENLPSDARFASARIVDSELENFSITECSDGYSRISGDIVTRFAVTYASGCECRTVTATVRESKDFSLRLPTETIIPYSIEVKSVMSVGRGAVIAPNSVTVSGCILQIVKVTAPVDILVPTYGYCVYPPCTGCGCAENLARIFPSLPSDGDS